MTATVRVSGLHGIFPLVQRLGGDAEQLCRDCGIDPQLLSQQDGLIPYRQLIHLTEHCARELRRPDFGLLLAASQDVGILGPLAVAIQNSATVQDAVKCAADHLFVQSRALELAQEDDGGQTSLRLRIRLNNMPQDSMCQAQDLGLGLAHRILSMLLGRQDYLLGVELPHKPLCIPSVYREYFGAPVQFECAASRLRLSTALMRQPLTENRTQLHQLAMAFLDVQFPTPDGRFSTRVETAIRRTLGTDSCKRDTVAAAMGMHPRTLQRRLKAEGETFDSILDRIRRDKGEYYLRNTAVPIAQIADSLGYSAQSVFSRSCVRWFGHAPRVIRNHATS